MTKSLTAATKPPIVLVILDGWGYSAKTAGNAIAQAEPKMFNYLWSHYPHAYLEAAGTAVGLPPDTMGNSEVGHLTIGAGKIIPQPLTCINESIADRSFFAHPILLDNLGQLKKNLKKTGRTLHLMGLLSDAGVHSHQDHLYALIQAARDSGIDKIFVHAFLDGRDTAPQSAQKYLHQLEEFLKTHSVKLGSITGRFYAMDRDKNWERTQQVYDMLTGQKNYTSTIEQAWNTVLQQNYDQNISDEFLPPTLISSDALVHNGDGIIFFNFRPDRMRQLTSLFLSHNAAVRPLFVISMTRYDDLFTNPVLLEQKKITDTLFDQLKAMGKTIFTIAETEKYAHVTYFFNGGREKKRDCETRILVPSHGAVSYATDPRMSADEITQKVLESLTHDPKDFYLINYANADMVGHSGDLKSTIEAITCLDEQLKKLYQEVIKNQSGILIITSDHGNAEEMLDATGAQQTFHTTNPVPFIFIKKNEEKKDKPLPLTKLADITSFIIQLME